jgi:hypothetical protein
MKRRRKRKSQITIILLAGIASMVAVPSLVAAVSNLKKLINVIAT